MADAGRMSVFIDLHGHSMREGTFFYGCEPPTLKRSSPGPVNQRDPLPTHSSTTLPASTPNTAANATTTTISDASPPPSRGLNPHVLQASATPQTLRRLQSERVTTTSVATGDATQPTQASHRERTRLQVRALPYIFARREPSFLLGSCSFRVHRCKATAGRAVVARELGVPCSYTLETSLSGDAQLQRHYSPVDLTRIGATLCESIAEFVGLSGPEEESLLEDVAAAFEGTNYCSIGNPNN